MLPKAAPAIVKDASDLCVKFVLFADQTADLMQVARDAYAEIFHFGIWRQQVRYHDGHHTCAGSGADAVVRVFERKTQCGIDPKRRGSNMS